MLLTCFRREAVVVVAEVVKGPAVVLVAEAEGNPLTLSSVFSFSSLLLSLLPLATAACSSAAIKAAVMASFIFALLELLVVLSGAIKLPVLSMDRLAVGDACSTAWSLLRSS